MTARDDPRKAFYIGLGIMFVLFGISAVIGVLYRYPISATAPDYFGWIGGLAGVAVAMLWAIFVIWAISFFFKYFPHSSRYRDYWASDEALEILRERYAKGEITKQEFEQMMQDLKRAREETNS
ncbi:MAG: SHOCT domain-containing protein [Thermoprotei archaeon]